MDALGGHTGNGLLFYKFLITDPDGNNNTAYYTTKNVYSYTPAKTGVYSVKAYVQNSNNTTVNQTYNYNCVTTIDESEDTPVPTATTPTIKPTTAPATTATTATTAPSTTAKPTDAPQTTQTTQTVPATTVADAKLGDVNADGKVDILDATLIQKYVASMNTIDTSRADTDKDNRITVKDATQIQKLICGIITSF
jgi:hypothetical protein